MLNQGEEGYMVFEPAVLEIAVGDTVTFKATDAAHNSASISGMIPEGAKAWSGDLSKDIIVTFDTPGVYGYQCTPHSMMAMVGLIKVGGEATNIEQIKAVAETLKPSFVMNKGRFDTYISKL
jgi:pseudoazurin